MSDTQYPIHNTQYDKVQSAKEQTPAVSVVLPVYNEEKNLAGLIPFLEKSLAGCAGPYEIIVIDGGSTDGTVAMSRKLGAKVVIQKEKGFGSAIKRGLELAKGKYIITMDADNSHPPDFVSKMIESKEGADLVIGSRFVSNSAYAADFWRKLLSLVLNRVFKFTLSLPINDLSSGFRIYDRQALEDIKIESKDFDVQLELLIKIMARGWRVKEIPIVYKKRLYGSSKARVVNCGLSFLKTFFKMYRLRNSIMSGDYDDRALRSRLLPQRLWHRFKDQRTFGYVERGRFTLDAGCGSGRFIQEFSNVLGLDIDDKKLRYLKLVKKVKNHFVLGDAEFLPFKNETFEQIMNSEVIEHIPNSNRIFKEFHRVLKSEGRLILTTPNYGSFIWPFLEWIYGKILPDAYADKHISRYNLERLKDALSENGFKIINHKFFLRAITIIKAQKTDVLRNTSEGKS